MLANKYNLTQDQIKSVYDKNLAPDKAQDKSRFLYPFEAYDKVVTNLGDLGYEQHLYVSTYFPLINAIRQGNDELIDYYLFRTPSLSLSSQDKTLANLCMYYALKTKNVKAIVLLLSYFGSDIFVTPLISPFRKKSIWKSHRAIYADLFSKLPITPLETVLVNDPVSIALKNIDIKGLIKLINNYGIRDISMNIVITFYPNTLISKKSLEKVKKIKEIVIGFNPSIAVDLYLLSCDILLGNNITLTPNLEDLIKSNNHINRILIGLIISVCHYPAFDIFEKKLWEPNFYVNISEVLYYPSEVFKFIRRIGSSANLVYYSSFLTKKTAQLLGYRLENGRLQNDLTEGVEKIDDFEELMHYYAHIPNAAIIYIPVNDHVYNVTTQFLQDHHMTLPTTCEVRLGFTNVPLRK